LGWGFSGYVFTLGIAMWGYATYVLLRGRAIAARAVVLAVFGMLTYFGHLSAFGVMMVSVLIFEVVAYLGSGKQASREFKSGIAVLFLAALGPVIVHLSLSQVGQSAGTALAAPVLWVTDLIMAFNPYRTMDVSIWSLAFWAVLGAFLLKKVVVVDFHLGWTALFLFGVFLLTPTQLYGSWYANTRLIPWIALVFLASLRTRASDARSAQWVAAASLLLLAAQAFLIQRLWSRWNEDYGQLMAGVRMAPRGTMFVALEQSGPVPKRRNFLESVSDDPCCRTTKTGSRRPPTSSTKWRWRASICRSSTRFCPASSRRRSIPSMRICLSG
jgi:hypothetical protein